MLVIMAKVHCIKKVLMHLSITKLLMQAEPTKWAGWVATEVDDLAQLVDEQLHEVADWDNNLKALKVSQQHKCCAALLCHAKVVMNWYPPCLRAPISAHCALVL